MCQKDHVKLFDIYYSNLITIDEHFNKKYRKLNQTKSILELKYKKYKWCNDFWNISIIGISSILTLIESCKLVFLDLNENYEEDNLTQNFFVLSPIFLGTTITGISSYIKFKKYQDYMEEIYILIDRCIGMLAKLKNKIDNIDLLIQDTLANLLSDKNKDKNYISELGEKVNAILNLYEGDIIKEYFSVYQETERYINFKDYDKYLFKIHKTDYKRHVLYKDKEYFYKEYDIEKHKDITEKYKDHLKENYFEKIRKNSMSINSNVKTHCFNI